MIKKNLFRIELTGLVLSTAMLALGGCAGTPEEAPPPRPGPVAVPAPVPEPETYTVEAEPAPAPSPSPMRPDVPDRYVVKKGDTLWDIAARFLKDPWRWPEVWHINPEIRNPHLIYPGDVIVLYEVDGKPYLTLEGAAQVPPPAPAPSLPVVKLEPRVRYEPIERAIETIPRSAIAPFLTRPVVVPERELELAPYVVSSQEDHLVSGTGARLYARGKFKSGVGTYYVVRIGDVLRDPETGDILGRTVLYLATANLLSPGDPTTLKVTKAEKEIIVGDRLLPAPEEDLTFNFFPRPPEKPVDGRIVSVLNGVVMIGQYNVVVLNRGARDGLAPGHVLAVYRGGQRARDIFTGDFYITPDERGGLAMVFKTYDDLSFAIIMEAYRALRVADLVRNP